MVDKLIVLDAEMAKICRQTDILATEPQKSSGKQSPNFCSLYAFVRNQRAVSFSPSLLLLLAACGGGGGGSGGGGYSIRFSGLPDEITFYEGQNKFPAFESLESSPSETSNGLRIKFDSMITKHEEEIVTVRGDQISYPAHSHTSKNIKATVTVIETGEQYRLVIPEVTIWTTVETPTEIDTDRNTLSMRDVDTYTSSYTIQLINNQGSLVLSQIIPRQTAPADGSTTEIPFKKITLIRGDQEATGNVVITAEDGEADEVGETLTADTSNIVDNNDLFPEFRFQWIKDGEDINGGTQKTFTPQIEGTYEVKVIVIDDQYPSFGTTSTEIISAEVEIA